MRQSKEQIAVLVAYLERHGIKGCPVYLPNPGAAPEIIVSDRKCFIRVFPDRWVLFRNTDGKGYKTEHFFQMEELLEVLDRTPVQIPNAE